MTQQIPIPMILHCPACRFQHVDAAEPHVPGECDWPRYACSCKRWPNPPHRTHLCKACGHLWKPANVPTTGVKELPPELFTAFNRPTHGPYTKHELATPD